MGNFKKHTDVVSTMEEFQTNYDNGVYSAPWIVYVGNDVDGYNVMYSSDVDRNIAKEDTNFIESIITRIENLENEKVFCYEAEYEELAAKGSGWVTNIDGTRSEVVYDPKKLYCIYEEEGPTGDVE